MLKVVDWPNADLGRVTPGQTFPVSWVAIDDPDAEPERLRSPGGGFPAIAGAGKSGCYLQGEARGAARFLRGEGAWWHDGIVYWVDTAGGAAGRGVVWAYQAGPRRDDGDTAGTLTALFVSPEPAVADHLDNLTVSPRGGLLLCEDGRGLYGLFGRLRTGTRLIGIDGRGEAFAFAENHLVLDRPLAQRPLIAPGDYRGQEFAGACFDPPGQTLFVNVQTPGVTFAIQGPWRALGL
jgi:hypothetical protein